MDGASSQIRRRPSMQLMLHKCFLLFPVTREAWERLGSVLTSSKAPEEGRAFADCPAVSLAPEVQAPGVRASEGQGRGGGSLAALCFVATRGRTAHKLFLK